MKGSPLLRALAAFLVILSLGYPLWRLTRAEVAAETAAPAPASTLKAINLALTFTTAAESFKVLHLGKVIWDESKPPAHLAHAVSLAYPPEGIDLDFEITWPAAAPLSAVRVQLTDPAGTEQDQTIWGREHAEEVLTFR